MFIVSMFTVYLYLVLIAIILTILYISKELVLVDLKQRKQNLEKLKTMTKQVVKCDISSYFSPSLDQINYKSKL